MERDPALDAPFWQSPAFRGGVVDFLPAALGIGAWGVMTGVAMVKSGMGTLEVLAMAIFVFAGSSQLAALPLIASGAPLWVIFAAAFCVNLRFVVFSLQLRPYVMHQPLWRRLLSGYLMGDLSYVLLVHRYPEPPTDARGIASVEAYWLGVGLAGWSTWTVWSLVGVVLGNHVPVAWGLGFAGVLSLVGVGASLVSSRLQLVSAVVAGAAALAAIALPLRLNIVVGIASAVAVCLVVDKSRRLVASPARLP